MLLRELVRYFLSTWMAFCVFYTMSDLYKKRRIVIKYYKLARRYGLPEIWSFKKRKTKCV